MIRDWDYPSGPDPVVVIPVICGEPQRAWFKLVTFINCSFSLWQWQVCMTKGGVKNKHVVKSGTCELLNKKPKLMYSLKTNI